ncbi:hypothetical protein ACH5RR_041755 [Cinchona calisaya]|uniref:Uncharacterized protein n=1 Tax=Cinchona calisaya TaxID=153742 RepID=A0ABD2XZW6_9GENT
MNNTNELRISCSNWGIKFTGWPFLLLHWRTLYHGHFQALIRELQAQAERPVSPQVRNSCNRHRQKESIVRVTARVPSSTVYQSKGRVAQPPTKGLQELVSLKMITPLRERVILRIHPESESSRRWERRINKGKWRLSVHFPEMTAPKRSSSSCGTKSDSFLLALQLASVVV